MITFPCATSDDLGGSCFGCGALQSAVMGRWMVVMDRDEDGQAVGRELCPTCRVRPNLLAVAKTQQAPAAERVRFLARMGGPGA